MRKDESKGGAESRMNKGQRLNYLRGLPGRKNSEASAPPTEASTRENIIPKKKVIASPAGVNMLWSPA